MTNNGTATATNIEVLQTYWKATTSGDVDTLRTIVADDAVFHYPGQHFISGDYHGKEEVAGHSGLYATLASMAIGGGMFEGHLHDVAASADGKYTVAILSYKLNLPGGKVLPGRACGLFRIIDGLIHEYWLFEWDQAMINDIFWSSAPLVFYKKGNYVRIVTSLPRTLLGAVRTACRVFSGYHAPTEPN